MVGADYVKFNASYLIGLVLHDDNPLLQLIFFYCGFFVRCMCTHRITPERCFEPERKISKIDHPKRGLRITYVGTNIYSCLRQYLNFRRRNIQFFYLAVRFWFHRNLHSFSTIVFPSSAMSGQSPSTRKQCDFTKL